MKKANLLPNLFFGVIINLMRKILVLFFLLISPLFLTGCLPKKKPAALQIDSFPEAAVFIDGKNVGKTPFVDRQMNPGEINVKLIPESTASALTSWEGKLKLISGVLTVVTREFAETDEFSSGDILTLEPSGDKKNASLAVITSPDGATVKLNGENRGPTPLVLDKISEGDYQINLSLPGYLQRNFKAKAIKGFKLIVNSKLAKEGGPEISPTPTVSVPVNLVTPKPTTAIKISPSLKPTVSITGAAVEIQQTETGWLRVRSGPGRSYSEVAKVYPGEKYPLLEEKPDWYKITYEEGKEGWVSSQYAKKIP